MSDVVWIIGAGSGIGQALAKRLSFKNHKICLSSRRKDALETVRQELHGSDHLVLPCDVVDSTSLQSAFDKIIETFGRLDKVIFAAGIYTPMPLQNYQHEDAIQTLDVNLKGAFTLFHVLHPYLFSKKSDIHLVWIASVAGYRGLPGSGAYGVSKAGLINFAEIQKLELQDLNTKVQLVNPGFVKTRLTDKNDFDMPQIITADKAARFIEKGMESTRFEISFPPLFTFFMRLLRVLPDRLYFYLVRKFVKS